MMKKFVFALILATNIKNFCIMQKKMFLGSKFSENLWRTNYWRVMNFLCVLIGIFMGGCDLAMGFKLYE